MIHLAAQGQQIPLVAQIVYVPFRVVVSLRWARSFRKNRAARQPALLDRVRASRRFGTVSQEGLSEAVARGDGRELAHAHEAEGARADAADVAS
jgi:hypothetical protein